MNRIISLIYASVVLIALSSATFAQGTGTISGQVADSLGDALAGANVVITDAGGNEKTTFTNNSGFYTVRGLAPGKYTVKITAPSFADFEKSDVVVVSGKTENLKVVMAVAAVVEEVDVSDDEQVSTDAATNATALVLKEEDIENLPDDPDDLEAALQALAGGGTGPNGGQIYIDGFEGGNIPPKESIREIRINRDPFSAEYDRLGRGRIEILTKPGTDKFRGQAYFNFNDSALNARNPFSENKADSQQKTYGGYLSGPIKKDFASFSLGLSNRDRTNGSAINATVIDPNFNVVPFQQEFTEPNKRFSVNPRIDLKINENNTFVARYEYERRTSENFGGAFVLPSRGTQTENTENTLQLTETAILNPRTVNETRFQYRVDNRETTGDNSTPAINVLDGFFGGGSTIGLNTDKQKFWEFQNYTTTSFGQNSQHSVKFGARIQGITLEDRTESNYNGTFTFTGFLDEGDINDPNDDVFVSSIEQYRQNLLGNPDPRYNPNQFSITTGNPLADISQYNVGLFIKDDWNVSPKLSLNFGLRYENQTNISDNSNFAPRFGFGFAPGAGGAKPPKTVLRGGIGIFYSRFGANNTLTAQRLDGIRQQQFIIGGNNPILGQAIFDLNGVTNVPTADQLANIAPLTSTPRIVADGLQAPYSIQGGLSVERTLPARSNLSFYYYFSRSLHQIRSRNINAPVCPPGFDCPVNDPVQLLALRPDPTQGNIYQYESSGVSTDQRFVVSFRTLLSNRLTVFGNYTLAKTKSNSDGGFPVYSYDISDEYADSSFDQRHRFFFFGSISMPYGFSIRPFIIAGSGRPFNITAGRDLNGDSIFNDRPTFQQLSDACAQVGVTASYCDLGDNDPNATVPRNYGRGPSSLTVNLGIDKTFGFGGKPAVQGENSTRRGRGGRRGGRRGGNVFGGGRGGFGGGERKPYNITFGVRLRNLFNINNVGNPVGNINSSLFGTSTGGIGGWGGGARRIEFRTRFRF
ncbi:MAG: hypothetical protein HKN25_15195 [Pyrinomonadaceae bacterium]|nr:hypothetical protein [Pyrinomonadaceae bacterium]